MTAFIKLTKSTYDNMVAVLEERKFKEVQHVFAVIKDAQPVEDGIVLRKECAQIAVNFMHMNCLHYQVNQILNDIMSAPVIRLDKSNVDDQNQPTSTN